MRWPAALSPARWATAQSPVALFVIRLLLVANTIVLTVVGGLSLAFVDEPAGLVGAVLAWALALGLLWLVPYTNPRRGSASRW